MKRVFNGVEVGMKSRFTKLFMGILTCMTIILAINIDARAENATVSVSTAGGAVGDTVAVNVSVTPDTDASAQIWLSYDTNYLEYVSGGNSGVAGVVSGALDEIKANENGTLTFNFKLKAAGSTTVNVTSNSEVKSKQDSTQLNMSAASGTVNIEGNTSNSSDSTLSGLVVQAVSSNGDKTNVSYTPSFSPDVHEYKADLSSDTTKLVIATTLSDSNATTQVSGTRIDAGDNKTTITVKAQDGSTTVYTVYTTRLSETTTAAENAQPGSESQTTDINRAPKQIDSIGMYLIQDFSLITVPEGFAEGTATMNGEQIAVLKGTTKDLTLVCLSTDIQGTGAKLCIYNEASGAIDVMVNITSTQKIYTVIPTDASYQGPEGYTETQFEVNGDTVKAWVKNPDTDFYVVYAMNYNGEKALYVYDKKEETMQRFVEGNKSENLSDEPPAENTEYLRMKKSYDDLSKEYKADHSKKNKIILGLIAIILCIALVLIGKKAKNKNTESKEIGYDELENDNSLSNAGTVKESDEDEINAVGAENNEEKKGFISTEESDENLVVSESDADVKDSNEELNNHTEEKQDASGSESEEIMIDMEVDEPFEIEFVDFDDENK